MTDTDSKPTGDVRACVDCAGPVTPGVPQACSGQDDPGGQCVPLTCEMCEKPDDYCTGCGCGCHKSDPQPTGDVREIARDLCLRVVGLTSHYGCCGAGRLEHPHPTRCKADEEMRDMDAAKRLGAAAAMIAIVLTTERARADAAESELKALRERGLTWLDLLWDEDATPVLDLHDTRVRLAKMFDPDTEDRFGLEIRALLTPEAT